MGSQKRLVVASDVEVSGNEMTVATAMGLSMSRLLWWVSRYRREGIACRCYKRQFSKTAPSSGILHARVATRGETERRAQYFLSINSCCRLPQTSLLLSVKVSRIVQMLSRIPSRLLIQFPDPLPYPIPFQFQPLQSLNLCNIPLKLSFFLLELRQVV